MLEVWGIVSLPFCQVLLLLPLIITLFTGQPAGGDVVTVETLVILPLALLLLE